MPGDKKEKFNSVYRFQLLYGLFNLLSYYSKSKHLNKKEGQACGYVNLVCISPFFVGLNWSLSLILLFLVLVRIPPCSASAMSGFT